MTFPKKPARARSPFRMPSVQTMKSRKSSITNAFVNSLLPVYKPSLEEIATALSLLGMSADNMTCVYCGGPYTEWDHLRPLVIGRRPTGYVNEIANLVPSCNKCNQSKRNENWREWMLSKADLSPTARGILDLEVRILRLEAYEQWRKPRKIDFEALVGIEAWNQYWEMLERVDQQMHECQLVANELRDKIIESLDGISEE